MSFSITPMANLTLDQLLVLIIGAFKAVENESSSINMEWVLERFLAHLSDGISETFPALSNLPIEVRARLVEIIPALSLDFLKNKTFEQVNLPPTLSLRETKIIKLLFARQGDTVTYDDLRRECCGLTATKISIATSVRRARIKAGYMHRIRPTQGTGFIMMQL